jgi:NhaP-type Na+/H+ or K+/H+ antiporter
VDAEQTVWATQSVGHKNIILDLPAAPAGLEIVLTLGAAYGCYFVAEELAGASGLLAVVVMGFSMSLLGE